MNNFFTNQWTETIQKVIREIVNDPSTYIGAKYLPSVALPVAKVRTEVIEASGGLTQEHVPGTNPKYITGMGTRVQEYEPPFYKEAIHYDEKKILFLRELGDNSRNVRGVQQYMENDIDKLNRRVEARIELQRWQTIFNGGFSWFGQTVSFGIPAGNRYTPSVPWSLDGVSANNSSNPLKDLRYALLGGLGAFRKYVVTKMVMNANTARWFLDNTNTLSYLSSYGANPALDSYELNKVLQFLSPGLPPVEIYKGWYQEEAVDAATGHVTVGDAIFFIPNGYIFFECSLPGSDKIGEFMQTLNLTGGSMNPQTGKFLVVEDNTPPGSKGGPANPYVDLIGGVYGGVKLDRAFDVLTAYVGP